MHFRKPRSRHALALLIAAAALGGATYAGAASIGMKPALPAGKRSHEAVIAAIRANLPHDATAKAAYIRANPTPPGLSHATAGTPESGILELAQAPFPRGMYAIQNRWQDLRGGTLIQVYSGADASDPAQGIVVLNLIAWPADQDITTRKLTTPAKAGSLRITAANGNDLTLTAESGQRFTFNVISRTLTSP
ncbi:MAG: hypothetical protein ACJ757_06040 [Gaiellaceae bacterium]